MSSLLDYDPMLFLVKQDHTIPPYVNFIIGGVSGYRCIGQTCTHPLDATKIRMQILRSSLRDTIYRTYQEHGVRGFYVGWTPAILRQLTYTTTRLGVYNTLYDLISSYVGRLNYPTMVTIGMFSGICGALVGTPADLIYVRMVGDAQLPPEKRRNYRHVFHGLSDIWKTEGVQGLWRGALPTMTRAMIVNGAQLGTYSRVKIMWKDTGLFEEGILLSFCSAMISGFVMSVLSVPVDVAKTRIQTWTLPSKPPGIIAAIATIARTEGVTSMWRGFLPYYSRAAPNAVITMVTLDKLRQIYRILFLQPIE
nr:mitochondrial 2-oxoglutarate/malate carrier protein-like [Bombus vancouverensis nearcticus]